MRLFLITAAAALMLTGSVAAQTPAPAKPAAKTATATTPKAPKKPRTAESIACSGKADAAASHGKARKAFMSSCKKAAAKS